MRVLTLLRLCLLNFSVSLDVLQDTSAITFNASKLTLHDVAISSELPVLEPDQVQTAHSFDEKAERVTVRSSTILTRGSKAQLKVRYEAELTDNMLGA